MMTNKIRINNSNDHNDKTNLTHTHTERKETITIYPGSNFFLQQCRGSRKIESTSLVVATVFMALRPGFVVTFEKARVKNCLCLNMKPNNPHSKTSQSGNRYDKNMIRIIWEYVGYV